MFTKIIIENILGINNKIEMNFMATPKKKEKKACRYRIVLGHIAAGSGRILYCLFPSSHVPEKMVMDPCFDSNSDCRYRLSGHGTHE